MHPSVADGANAAFSDVGQANCELSAHYDYVMVFKMEVGGDGRHRQTAATKDCMKSMIAAGLEIFPYQSVQNDEIYVLIRAPVSELCHLYFSPFYLLCSHHPTTCFIHLVKQVDRVCRHRRLLAEGR